MLKSLSFAACLALSVAALSGCVERKITIISDPPGALVHLNDQEVGRTPVTVPFTWYGDYDVRLRLERPEPTAEKPNNVAYYYLHTHKVASAPPYQWLGVDLVAELSPHKFVDEKVWAFNLPRVETLPDGELVNRARDLKSRMGEPVELQKGRK